jgi:hypothetical protein
MAIFVTRLRDVARKMATGVIAVGCALLVATPAGAVNQRVRNACKDDYFRFCPAYAPDTAELRSCMRQVGKRLSPRCVDALVDSGEIRRSQARR